jgi:hypothetical protein
MKHNYLWSVLLFLTAFFGVSSAHAQSSAVTTVPPLNGGNQQSGIAFNVKAYQALVVDSIWVTLYNYSGMTISVWYKTDSINGAPTVSTTNGWVQALSNQSVTVSGSGGPGTLTKIPHTFAINMPAGAVYGFYIETNMSGTGTISYTNWASPAQYLFSNGVLHINNGQNVGYGGPSPNPTFHPRQFNGKIGYTLASSCTAPSGLGASGITNNTATLNWGSVSGSQGYEYVLDQTAANPSGAGTSTTNTSYNATGLSPNTTYFMHVRNKCSSTSFSAWVTVQFTTLNFVSCYPVTAGGTANMTSSTAMLQWAPVSGSNGYEWIVNQTSASPLVNGAPTSGTTASVTGLTGGATYWAHVRNVCQPNDKSAWLNYSFTTPVCNKPTNLFVSNINDNSADMMWTLMPNASSYDYSFSFSKQNPTTGILSTTNMAAHLTPLIPNSKYYVHVRSRCFGTDTSDWKLDSFVTMMQCFAPIVNVNLLGTNTPSAYWDPVPTAIGYEYALTNFETGPAFGTNTTQTSVALTLPTDGLQYYLHVRTKCNSMFTFSPWTTVKLRDGSALSVRSAQQGNAVQMYPNPVTDKLHLKGLQQGNYRVSDVTGRVLLQGSVTGDMTITTTSLAPGSYLLHLVDGSYSHTFRFAKH